VMPHSIVVGNILQELAASVIRVKCMMMGSGPRWKESRELHRRLDLNVQWMFKGLESVCPLLH
jgi:hypothetical protein